MMHQNVEDLANLPDGTRVRPYRDFERERYTELCKKPKYWDNYMVYEHRNGNYDVADASGFIFQSTWIVSREIQTRMPPDIRRSWTKIRWYDAALIWLCKSIRNTTSTIHYATFEAVAVIRNRVKL